MCSWLALVTSSRSRDVRCGDGVGELNEVSSLLLLQDSFPLIPKVIDRCKLLLVVRPEIPFSCIEYPQMVTVRGIGGPEAIKPT